MEIVLILVASVGIGMFAQIHKGRTGIAWAIITFIALMWFSIVPSRPVTPDVTRAAKEVGEQLFYTIVALMIVVPVMAIIVATLPGKKGGKKVEVVDNENVW